MSASRGDFLFASAGGWGLWKGNNSKLLEVGKQQSRIQLFLDFFLLFFSKVYKFLGEKVRLFLVGRSNLI